MPDVPLPPRRARAHFTFEPMPDDHGPAELLETLLKHPGRIIHELHADRRRLLAAWFLLFALCGMAIYGVVVGSLSGGAQLWIAPVKLALGTLLAVLICLPSLYIFSCLAGSEFRLRAVAGVLAAAVCLSSLLLIGFAPVAWIFSQSTDSLPLMGTLHLFFWLIRSELRSAPARRDEPLPRRKRWWSPEIVVAHFHPRLPANDYDPATHYRALGPFSPAREEVFPHLLA